MGIQETRKAARPRTLTPSRSAADDFRPAPTELPRDESEVTDEARSLPARVLRAARDGLGRRGEQATADDPGAVYDKARREASTRLAHARGIRSSAVAAEGGGGRGGFGAAAPRPRGPGKGTRRMAKRKAGRIGLFRLALIMAVAGALGSWLGLHLQDAFNDAIPHASIYGVESQGDKGQASSGYTF